MEKAILNPRGLKQVFLPNFVIKLLRTDHLPPTQARFDVPLSFNKLDLRDYLFHVYNVRCLSIRSFLKHQKVVRNNKAGGRRRLYVREPAQKTMTIQMKQPFIWPSAPEDFSPWDRDIHEDVQKSQREEDRRQQFPVRSISNLKHKSTIAEQAKQLLEGKEKWRPTWQELKGNGGSDNTSV